MPRPGDLVRLNTGERCGTEREWREVHDRLEIGKPYEVVSCEAGSSWSRIELVGMTGLFNAIMFDVERRD